MKSITTPIYYGNDIPHLGTAYTTFAADSLHRAYKLLGISSYFQTGTDEHGLKIQRKAVENNLSEQQYVDKTSQIFQDTWKKLDIDYSFFIRTTDEFHKKEVSEFWNLVKSKGFIYKGNYEGLYCVGCEAFKTEKDLVDGLCPDHQKPLEPFKEETYFFKLSAFQDKLLEFYEKNPNFILPKEKRNEIISLVKSGLQDISISRSNFTWGIPVPDDPDHVIYVWFDALLNYISGTIHNEHHYNQYIHIIGKDILKFHAIYYPAFLMATGDAGWDCYFPETILTHGFINIDGKKISKSVKSLKDISLDDLLSLTGSSDSLRHYLLSNISFGKDGNFDESSLIDSHNASLVKNFGNLIQRVLSIKAKFPPIFRFMELETNLNDIDKAFISDIETKFSEIKTHWEKFEINEAISKTFLVSSLANKYVDQTAPWVSLKENNLDRLEMILKVLIGAFKCLASFMAPILPQKSAELSLLLGELKPTLFIDKVEIKPFKQLPAPKHLFPFIEQKK